MVVNDVLLSHEQEIHPTISLDGNCKKFDFQTDRNYCVDFKQTHLPLKPKLVEDRGGKNYKSKKKIKEQKEEPKAQMETDDEQESPIPLITHVNSILNSFFSNVEEYIMNQQLYISIGLHAQNV